jgi:Tol biopolymer transport system component
MTEHTDIREFLREMADEVPPSPVEPRPAVRRAKRRLVRTLTAATLAVAAIATGSAVGIGRLTAAPPSVPAHPAPSFLPAYHHNGEVVVYGFFGHQSGVVAVDPVTGHQHALPITGFDGLQSRTVLAWSPDGSQLAYTVRDEVRTLSMASGSSRKIATCNALSASSSGGRQQCTGLAWSPDGSTIAVGQVSSSLWLIDPNGHILATLTPKPGWIVGNAAWSPDSSRIAFVAGNDPLDGHSISLFVMNRDGSDLRLLVAGVMGGAPAWSPDGKKIAYLRGEPVKDGSGDSEVIVSMIDSDGSNPVQVMRAGRCACVGFSPGLTWSPDGTKLAVVTATMPDGRGGLATVNPDGTGLRFLAASGWGSPAWRPVP